MLCIGSYIIELFLSLFSYLILVYFFKLFFVGSLITSHSQFVVSYSYLGKIQLVYRQKVININFTQLKAIKLFYMKMSFSRDKLGRYTVNKCYYTLLLGTMKNYITFTLWRDALGLSPKSKDIILPEILKCN